MLKRINKYFKFNDFPNWFKYLSIFLLLPILIWPFVFYTTIFLFDNPVDIITTYFYFLLINLYPIYLLGLTYLNSLLFKWNRALGSILPMIFFVTIIGYLSFTAYEIYKTQKKYSKEYAERKRKGILGNGFVKRNNQIFLDDSLVKEADAETFEIVNWDWSKDKKIYFFHGKSVPIIDYNSFKIIDYHYSKDKNHVYYDEEIISEADPKTFEHINGTNDAKDKTNCYRYGEKVDCNMLLTEE